MSVPLDTPSESVAPERHFHHKHIWTPPSRTAVQVLGSIGLLIVGVVLVAAFVVLICIGTSLVLTSAYDADPHPLLEGGGDHPRFRHVRDGDYSTDYHRPSSVARRLPRQPTAVIPFTGPGHSLSLEGLRSRKGGRKPVTSSVRADTISTAILRRLGYVVIMFTEMPLLWVSAVHMWRSPADIIRSCKGPRVLYVHPDLAWSRLALDMLPLQRQYIFCTDTPDPQRHRLPDDAESAGVGARTPTTLVVCRRDQFPAAVSLLSDVSSDHDIDRVWSPPSLCDSGDAMFVELLTEFCASYGLLLCRSLEMVNVVQYHGLRS